MKIKKLILKNYKVFDHLELDFTDKNGKVLDTIVLAGLNGTGKTTILELLTDLMNGRGDLDEKNLKPNTQILLEILLPAKIGHDKYVNIPELPNDAKERPHFSDEYFSPISRLVTAQIINYGLIDSPKGYDIFNGFPIYLQSRRRQYYADGWNKLDGITILASDKNLDNKNHTDNIRIMSFREDKDDIKQYILHNIKEQVFQNPDKTPREVFTSRVNELNGIFGDLRLHSKLVSINEKELIFKSVNGNEINFEALSSGEKMLYFMGFELNACKINDGVIMIDQPEDSLHPKWQQQITKFFQNVGENNQVILATHSPQIIASVHPESVFVLGVNEETGKVEAFNMEKEHKYSFGVEPNRILDEIMGVPARNETHEAQIKNILQMIKEVKFNLSKVTIEDVEQAIAILEQDYGKQDLTIMRFQNEVWLLKRKVAVAK